MNNDLGFDLPVSPEVREIANQLNEEELKEIDEMLLSEASHQFRKVARLVGWALSELKDKHPKLSDGFYSERVQELVKNGKLESQGDLRRMRYSEVKLCS